MRIAYDNYGDTFILECTDVSIKDNTLIAHTYNGEVKKFNLSNMSNQQKEILINDLLREGYVNLRKL